MHPMELLDEVYRMESRFGPVGVVFVSVQESCMDCAQCIIGSEIIVEVPDGTPRLRGSSGRSVLSIWR